MPRRITATNRVTGEKVSFDWNSPDPPSAADVENISDQRRTAKIESFKKMQQNDDNIPIVDKILTSGPGKFALNTLGALGLNQPWHPMEGLSNVGEGMSRVIQGTQKPGQPPAAHPRIAGAVQAVKGAMQVGGAPATALGYALAPVPTAAAMLIGSGAAEGTQAVLPDDWSPEVREGLSTSVGLAAGGYAGHKMSGFGPPVEAPPPKTGVHNATVDPRGWTDRPLMDETPQLHPPTPKALPAPMGPPQAPQGFHPLDPMQMPMEHPLQPRMIEGPVDTAPVPYGPEEAPIPMPPAGTFQRQTFVEKANQFADQQLANTPEGARQANVQRLSALADRLGPTESRPVDPGLTKPVNSPSEVSSVQPPEIKAPEVVPEEIRSQVEQTPPPSPAPESVSQVPAVIEPPAPPAAPEAITPEVLPPEAPKPVESLTIAQRAMQRAGAMRPPVEVKPPAPVAPVAPPVLPTAPVPQTPPQAPSVPPPAPVLQQAAPVVLPPAPVTPTPAPVAPIPPQQSMAARAIENAKNKPGPVRPPGFTYEPPPPPTLLDTISTGTKDPKLQGALKKYIKANPEWTPEDAGAHLASVMPKVGDGWKQYSPEAYTDYARSIKQSYDAARAKETIIPEEPAPEPTPAEESELAPPVQQKVNRTNDVLDFLKRRQNVTPGQIQTQFGLPATEVIPMLRDLVKRGLVDAKTGKYNYIKLPGEKITPADVAPVEAPKPTEPGPVATVGGEVAETPKPKAAPKEEAPALSSRAKRVEELKKDWQDEEDPVVSKALKSQYDSEAKNLQIEQKGTKKQKEILAELDNVSKRVDELETKDSDGSITKEEQAELADQYKQLNKLERKRDDLLIPEEEKYGPRVANLRSVHAEGQLSGLDHGALSSRAKEIFKVDSMKELTPEQLKQFEDTLKSEREDKASRFEELDEKETNGELTPEERTEYKKLCGEMGGGH